MSSNKGARVSIPDSVRKIIQNIHDITAAHEDEIHATLKECAMDPNETVERLLSQDTFHEVKSKRDRRKENSSIKEPSELRRKPGQGRGSRGGRGNYSSRYTSNDSGGRISSIGKENTSNQASAKIAGLLSSSVSQEPQKNEAIAVTSSASATANGPSALLAKGTKADISKLGVPVPHKHLDSVKENPRENFGTGKTLGRLISSSSNNSAVETWVSSPGSQFSSSDPVLVPSQDLRTSGAAGTIKREVGCQQTPAEQISLFPSEGKTVAANSEVGNFSVGGNIIQTKSIGDEQIHQSDIVLRPSSAHGGSSTARPLSNHSSRSQVVGPPKVVSSKEWKPKSSNPSIAQGSSTAGQSEVSAALDVNNQSCPVTVDLDSKEVSTKLQRKLEELHVPDGQHVILPNHLHVPGAEKISFCFGSFDAISLGTGFKNVPDDSIPSPPSETCQSVEEMADQTSSLQTAVATTKDGDYHDHPHSPALVPENLSLSEQVVPSAGSHEYGELKQENDLSQGSLQYPMVHASSGYGFGLVPTMMGSQLPPFENSESQAHDISRVPSFVVPQPFDLASYYAQFYRSADSDGRISPFHAPGVATKYNGSVAVLPPLTSQPAQEGGNSLVMSTSGPTAFATQPAAGVVPSSIAVTQQTIPVFRQPFGIPFPHYPPNYMPYGPYFSPLFVPHFNQSLNNSVYPQQPQAGGVFPAVPGPSPKFPFSQYKAGTSSGNSTSVGVANSYGSYGPSASTVGNSTTNEDLTAQQLKESNVYITGQQNEGSAVWLTPPGRDMSGVQANSFYNIHSQGQVAFSQPQPGHGPFTGIYHTAQAVSATGGHPLLQQSQSMASAVDIAGPPAPNVYQQSQHVQVSWANCNY